MTLFNAVCLYAETQGCSLVEKRNAAYDLSPVLSLPFALKLKVSGLVILLCLSDKSKIHACVCADELCLQTLSTMCVFDFDVQAIEKQPIDQPIEIQMGEQIFTLTEIKWKITGATFIRLYQPTLCFRKLVVSLAEHGFLLSDDLLRNPNSPHFQAAGVYGSFVTDGLVNLILTAPDSFYLLYLSRYVSMQKLFALMCNVSLSGIVHLLFAFIFRRVKTRPWDLFFAGMSDTVQFRRALDDFCLEWKFSNAVTSSSRAIADLANARCRTTHTNSIRFCGEVPEAARILVSVGYFHDLGFNCFSTNQEVAARRFLFRFFKFKAAQSTRSAVESTDWVSLLKKRMILFVETPFPLSLCESGVRHELLQLIENAALVCRPGQEYTDRDCILPDYTEDGALPLLVITDLEYWTALELSNLLIRVIKNDVDQAKNLRVLVFYTWPRYAGGGLLSMDYIDLFAGLCVPCVSWLHSWLNLKDVTRHGVILQWLYTCSVLSDADQYTKLMDVLLQTQYSGIQCVSHKLMPPDLPVFQSTDDDVPALLQYKVVFSSAQRSRTVCGILLKVARIPVLICAMTFFEKVFIFV
jgi:hypothetical protein